MTVPPDRKNAEDVRRPHANAAVPIQSESSSSTSETPFQRAVFERLVRRHRRALAQVRTDLDAFIEDTGTFSVLQISSRLKTYESALLTATGRGRSILKLADIAGLRIVVGTAQEKEVISRFFEQGSHSKRWKLLSQKDLNLSNGYRARHIIVELESHILVSMYPARVEVQIRTVLEHAFDDLSRSWNYKRPNLQGLSRNWKREMAQLSRSLRELDALVSRLQQEVNEASATHEPKATLTPATYREIARRVFGEDRPLDSCVDETRRLVDVGYATNELVEALFNSPAIAHLRSRCEAVARQATSAAPLFQGLLDVAGGARSAFYTFWGVSGEHLESLLAQVESEIEKQGDTSSAPEGFPSEAFPQER